MGDPQVRWMVDLSENPNLKWMMTGGSINDDIQWGCPLKKHRYTMRWRFP